METRKDKINANLSEYIQLRKNVFGVVCVELNRLELMKIKERKHKVIQDLFEYFIDEEYDNILNKLREITFPNPGCAQHLAACKREEYYKCLDSQQKEISDMLDDNYADVHVIINTPEGMEWCHVDHYYDGRCQNVDIFKLPSDYAQTITIGDIL